MYSVGGVVPAHSWSGARNGATPEMEIYTHSCAMRLRMNGAPGERLRSCEWLGLVRSEERRFQRFTSHPSRPSQQAPTAANKFVGDPGAGRGPRSQRREGWGTRAFAVGQGWGTRHLFPTLFLFTPCRAPHTFPFSQQMATLTYSLHQ